MKYIYTLYFIYLMYLINGNHKSITNYCHLLLTYLLNYEFKKIYLFPEINVPLFCKYVHPVL